MECSSPGCTRQVFNSIRFCVKCCDKRASFSSSTYDPSYQSQAAVAELAGEPEVENMQGNVGIANDKRRAEVKFKLCVVCGAENSWGASFCGVCSSFFPRIKEAINEPTPSEDEYGVSRKEDRAIKNDYDKLPLELIPYEVLEAYASTLSVGAKKYGRRNWELGFAYSRLFGAALRHLYAWYMGQEEDGEGVSHLGAAFFNIGAIIHHQKRGVGEDDRP